MATYLIKHPISIARQEGDTADIVVTVPEVLNMDLYTEVKLQVVNASRNIVFSKSVSAGTITVAGQTITIPLLVADTKNKPGEFKWEMEISNATPEVITIGRGKFAVIAEQIR